MKYVKNNGRYAFTYTYLAGDREVKVIFDRQRIYMDTGNVATSGITEVDDKVFEALEKNKVFKADLDNGILELTEAVKPAENDEIAKLKAENEKLQKKLNKDESAKEMKKLEEEKDKLEKENADMKAKLEALAKDNKQDGAPTEPANTDDSEDF